MKVVMSINADIKEFFCGDLLTSVYGRTCELYSHFVNHGHDVSFVCPSEVIGFDGAVFQKEYKLEDSEIVCVGSNIAPEGDVFFMRGFGQDAESVDVTKRFFDSMGKMERRFNLMVNSPHAVWYDLKNYQKKLDAPFIPSPKIRNISDLEASLNAGERIVAKPNSGLLGNGLLFLDDAKDARKHLGDSDFREYSFEYGVYGDETRYVFLNGDPVVRRILRKPHVFGVQETIRRDIVDIEENPRELEVAKKMIREIGAFYGCVDFKGQGPNGSPQVLEYNGSGTDQRSLDMSGEIQYDFGDRIVKEVEKKVG